MNTITVAELALWQRAGFAHTLLDVRRAEKRAAEADEIAGGEWQDPARWLDWKDGVARDRPAAVYCAFGHEISQGLCAALRALGIDARHLDQGIAGWRQAGLAVAPLARRRGTQWVTRARPKIDRIACPWLILRFIDATAEFLYVPADQVLAVAAETGAVPYDIPGVEMSHVGERCSFDAFIARHGLDDPALLQMATIVRGADTSRLDLAPQAAGLYALSLGLSQCWADDHEMLRHGLVMYDALYAWCRSGQGETHVWPPLMPVAPAVTPG